MKPGECQYLYRYDGFCDNGEYIDPSYPKIYFYEFPVMKTTPQGCWIYTGYSQRKTPNNWKFVQ